MAPRTSTLIAWVSITIVFTVALAWLCYPYLATVGVGLILAVVAAPLTERFAARISHTKAALLVTLLITVGVLLPIGMVGFAALNQAAELARHVDGDALSAHRVASWIGRWAPVNRMMADPEGFEAQVKDAMNGGAQTVGNVALRQISAAPHLILHTSILVFSTFCFLADGEAGLVWLRRRVPLPPRIFGRLIEAFQGAATGSVLASLVASGLHALGVLATFWILGIPAGFVAAGAALVLSWVPVIGVLLVWGAAVAWLVMSAHYTAVVGVVVAAILVGILDTFARPWVLRGHHPMHPLLGLVAIVGGLATLGVPGLLIGPVLAAVVVAILDLWPQVGEFCGLSVRTTEHGGDVRRLSGL